MCLIECYLYYLEEKLFVTQKKHKASNWIRIILWNFILNSYEWLKLVWRFIYCSMFACIDICYGRFLRRMKFERILGWPYFYEPSKIIKIIHNQCIMSMHHWLIFYLITVHLWNVIHWLIFWKCLGNAYFWAM